MSENQPQSQLYLMKWLLKIITIFLILLTLVIGGALTYAQTYRYAFFPGVKIANVPAGGQTQGKVINFWQNKIDQFQKSGLKYKYLEKEITVYPILSATDPDAAYRLVDFDVPATADAAWLIGRKHGYTANFLEQFKTLILGTNLALKYQLNQEDLTKILKNNFDFYVRESKNARPKFNDAGEIEILAEESGTTFDYNDIIKQTNERINLLSSEPITLKLTYQIPAIKKENITEENISSLKLIVETKNITLTYQKNKWDIPAETFKNWLAFNKDNEQIKIVFDPLLTKEYLEKNIAPKIFKPVLDAKFSIKNGKVTEFQGSQDGLELAIDKTIEALNQQIIEAKQEQAEAIVVETKSQISTGSLNEMGVKEIIGIGHSNFKGSPKNRRKNIANGAASINGVLIKPGETFSLVKALGEINGSTGYVTELVIKGDRTIPEFGGGLCQIGTTVFRAALATGLPIVERRNHSYRVVYYEPAGTDATIYDPSPDLKFLNDTATHILIQSRIEGDDIYFDFWGTKDNRVIEQSDPIIYNIRSAGPVINIETEELKPGEKKCIETAHAGADAYFDYKVTYPNGEEKSQRFSSHYIPWPAKCLIGKTPTLETTPTSTLEIIQQ